MLFRLNQALSVLVGPTEPNVQSRRGRDETYFYTDE